MAANAKSTPLSGHPTERHAAPGPDLFRNLFEHFTHGLCITDRKRTVIWANREMERLTGRSRQEMAGRPVTDLYAKGCKALPDLPALRRGRPSFATLLLKRRHKDDLPVRVRYSLIADPDGQEILGETYSDLSERLRFDEVRNEFVFIAAHELRSPVAAVKMLLDMAFEDRRLKIDPILRDYLTKLQEAGRRLSDLVDDLTEVARTESGRLKIEASPQDLTEHVSRVLGDIRPTAVAKGLVISYAPDASLPPVMADPMKLKEVLANLVSNAVKYNVTDGAVSVTHTVEKGRVLTTVSDTGIGISREDQKRLFSKFWRSEDPAIRAQAGTGLGLHIVRELVNRMGGEISFESAHGRGTAFTFSLPTADKR